MFTRSLRSKMLTNIGSQFVQSEKYRPQCQKWQYIYGNNLNTTPTPTETIYNVKILFILYFLYNTLIFMEPTLTDSTDHMYYKCHSICNKVLR